MVCLSRGWSNSGPDSFPLGGRVAGSVRYLIRDLLDLDYASNASKVIEIAGIFERYPASDVAHRMIGGMYLYCLRTTL